MYNQTQSEFRVSRDVQAEVVVIILFHTQNKQKRDTCSHLCLLADQRETIRRIIFFLWDWRVTWRRSWLAEPEERILYKQVWTWSHRNMLNDSVSVPLVTLTWCVAIFLLSEQGRTCVWISVEAWACLQVSVSHSTTWILSSQMAPAVQWLSH
jgi:hypothetical protein